jgi:hypothetical protein
MRTRELRLWTLVVVAGLGIALTGVITAQAAGYKLSGGSQVEEESVRFTDDGNWVVYIEYDSPGGTLYSASTDGSTTHQLAQTPITGGAIFIQPRVSPDSQRAVFLADHETDEVWELFSVPIDGSAAPTKLNTSPVAGGDVISDFYVTADSLWVVYTADQNSDEVFEVFSVPIDGSAAPTKLNGTLTSGGDVWLGIPSPNGQTVVYRADQNTDELWELFAVPTDGSATAVKISGTPAGGGDVFGIWQVSPDETRVVYNGDQDTIGVWEVYSAPIDGSTGPTKLNGTMTSDGDVQSNVEITADSTRVIYRADQDTDEVYELYSAPIDGSGGRIKLNGTLATDGDVDFTYRVSSDSSRVVYLADQDTNDVFELFSVPVGGGTPVRLHDPLTALEDVQASSMRIGNDSSRVVFVSDQDSEDVFELFSSAITGGGAIRISGTMPALGDVNWIFDVSDQSNRILYKADQDTDEVFELFSVPVGGGPVVKATDPVIPAAGDVNYGFFAPGNDSIVISHGDTETDGVYELFVSQDAGFAFSVDHAGDAGDLDTSDGLCATATGDCTLRAALEQANVTAGLNRVTFAIPGAGVHTISPGSALPTSTGLLEMDATTQPSYAGSPLVALDGASAGASTDGLAVTGDSIIRGLAITGFSGDGLVLSGGGNRVENCFIGLDPDGTANANFGVGVNLSNPVADFVGGVAAAGNVISGNISHGVAVSGSGHGWVSGNMIGTDPTGTSPVPNGGHGVAVNSIGSLELHIGVASPGLSDANVLAFNALDGVSILGSTPNVWAWDNSVHDNGGLGIDYEPPNGVGGGTYPIPTIADVTVGGGSTEISGTLPSAWATFAIAVYSSSECDPSGSGEGEVYLGRQAWDGAPIDTFTMSLPTEVAARDVVTATFASEGGSTSEFSTCVIVNESPVAGDGTWLVAEDASLGTVVGTVLGSDVDGDDLSYAITAGDSGGTFAIDGATGVVTVATALDFETTSAYTLTVEVSDGLLSDTATVTINVTDVAEFVEPDEATFADVPETELFHSEVEWLAWSGITKGCNPPDNTEFCPDDFVTRGQMAAFMHRALGDVLTLGPAVTFDDDDGVIFETDIEWLAATGVTKGCNPPDNTEFCPDDFVTRGQMAAFMERALG